ncbi:MAG: hypothetical protein PWP74_548 [Shewanella sp.]|nr:hypothetical protein [Shewanella sp.]
MKILLELPTHILNENLDGFRKITLLYNNFEQNSLNNFPVSREHSGATKSYFGDDIWDLSAYIDRKIANKSKLIFSEISSETLANEIKFICFSWLYTPAGKSRAAPLKPSSIIALHSKLMQIYKYLDKIKLKSIAQLSHPVLFYEFCNFLTQQNYSYANCEHIFITLRKVERSYKYLPFELEIPSTQSSAELSSEFCGSSKSKNNQFYAIPTSIMEKIYGIAINNVNEFFPHKELLSELTTDIRLNYEIGRNIVDKKIDNGVWNWINKDSEQYRVEVNKHKPQTYYSIVKSYFIGTPLEKYIISNSIKFSAWLSKILVSCYMVCAAFTGMRKSELYCLHSDSFKKRNFNGKTIYTLQSSTHKMVQGRGKLTEWVTSPITEKAISLAEALTRNMREQLVCSEDPMKNYEASCLWLSQTRKNEPPKILNDKLLSAHFINLAEDSSAILDDASIDEFKLINPNRNIEISDKKISLGATWPLTSHQFRRTFAVFVRRHSLCSVVAVKDQFKHLDIPTSDWYGEGGTAASLQSIEIDTDLKQLIKTVTQEMVTDNLHRWYNSSEKLYGKRGKEIMKERNLIPKDMKTWEEINEQVKAGRLNLVGTLHSYCLAGYECRMDKIASTASCFKCENQLIDEEKAQNWVKRHKWATEQVIYLESINKLTSSAESHYITQIRATERVMYYFNIPFEKFRLEGERNE